MLELKKRLTKDEILEVYKSGFKKTSNFKIGIEYERLPINLNTAKTVPYEFENIGIKSVLKEFSAQTGWKFIYDDKNIIGLNHNHDTITLEPGSQVEISAEPQRTIFEVKNKIDIINSILEPITSKKGIKLLEYGVTPLSTYKSINLIPKRRYHIMAKYLWGILSDVMMRETAGIQCCIDFSDEADAMRKFKLANKLTPFMTAMFANSPIRGGVDTGYKSFRALSWLNTDNDRCGFCGKISEEFTFEDYVDTVLKTPIIYLEHNNRYHEVNGDITFGEYMLNGYNDLQATLDDYLLQANLYFPEVRLRNFIEIRNHDCVGGDLKYSILAIYKGIFYSESGMKQCEELLKDLQYKDYSELRYNVPKSALMTKVKKVRVLDYAKEIINIAQNSLKQMGTKEEIFLEEIKKYTFNGICPADVVFKNWSTEWNRDVKQIIKIY